MKGLPSSQKGMWQEVMSAWMRSSRDWKSDTSTGRAMGVTLVTATCGAGGSGGGARKPRFGSQPVWEEGKRRWGA